MKEIKVLKEAIELAEDLHTSWMDVLDRVESSKQEESKAA